jgi:outer membrane protein
MSFAQACFPFEAGEGGQPRSLRRTLSGVRLGMFVFCLTASVCNAQSLAVLFEMARGSDPSYLVAQTGVDVAEARKGQAWGAMLPQISISANTNENDREYQTRRERVPTLYDKYNSNSQQISLTQPLWRYANIVGVQQAGTVVEQANHQLVGAEQELFSRLTGAWFDLLAARDNILFTREQMAALQIAWESSRRGAELGTHSLPQMEEARAKYDQSVSDVLTAETELHVKRATLEQIVGDFGVPALPLLRGDMTPAPLDPFKLEDWQEIAMAENPAKLAAEKAFQAAQDEVRKQRAGHQPTLDLVSSYGKNAQAVGGFPGQAGYDINTATIGVQLNIPIFSGGAQSAKVDEAVAQKEKARLELETANRNAILGVKQAWFGWHAARAKVSAGRQLLKSAASGVELARLGRDKGLKSDADYLQAQQQLRMAERDFRKARYDQMLAHVKLKAFAGKVTIEDVRMLDTFFDYRASGDARQLFSISSSLRGEGQ